VRTPTSESISVDISPVTALVLDGWKFCAPTVKPISSAYSRAMASDVNGTQNTTLFFCLSVFDWSVLK